MSLRLNSIALGVASTLVALGLASNDARACGGCFHPENPSQPETTLVTGHRMALSISQTQTVLWDQVQYSGAPSEFAWVLPVKAGARVELSNDSWFESLDAATSTRVVPPQLNCVQQNFGNDAFEGGGSSGCACGLGAADAAGAGSGAFGGSGGGVSLPPPPPPVTVVHDGSVGPYDTVTLHANVPGSLTGWLTMHGFAIDPSVQPIIDAYTSEGFDFIALRLKPDQGIQQMKPVRVISPGAVPSLPLRMVSAGTGANVDITLFVIGEGRWETKNFPNATADAKKLSWDFTSSASNYPLLRAGLLATNEGRTWVEAYAKKGALLSGLANPTQQGSLVQYTTGANGVTATTIGQFYVSQGFADGETMDTSCGSAVDQYANSGDQVVDLCPPKQGMGGGGTGGGGTGGGGTGGGGTGTGTGTGTGGTGGSGGAETGTGGAGGGSVMCGTPASGQIDARVFACGTLDDLGVALTGTHPRDVWLTRLEAHLPHAALKDDLQIQAATEQVEAENWLTATVPVNPPCQLAAGPIVPMESSGSGPRGGNRTRDRAAMLLALGALGAALARRMGRRARGLLPARSGR